jgi:hypothetical protein
MTSFIPLLSHIYLFLAGNSKGTAKRETNGGFEVSLDLVSPRCPSLLSSLIFVNQDMSSMIRVSLCSGNCAHTDKAIVNTGASAVECRRSVCYRIK